MPKYTKMSPDHPDSYWNDIANLDTKNTLIKKEIDSPCPDCDKSIFNRELLIVAGPVTCKRCQVQTCQFCAQKHSQKTCKKLPFNCGSFPLEKSDILLENCCRCRYTRLRGTETVENPEKCYGCGYDICAYCIKDLTELKKSMCAVEQRRFMSEMEIQRWD